jgi:hypothetical protein
MAHAKRAHRRVITNGDLAVTGDGGRELSEARLGHNRGWHREERPHLVGYTPFEAHSAHVDDDSESSDQGEQDKEQQQGHRLSAPHPRPIMQTAYQRDAVREIHLATATTPTFLEECI